MPARDISGFDADVVSAAVRQPPLDHLYAAASTRRRRRRPGIVLGAVVALVATAAIAPLAAGRPRPAPLPADPERPVSELFVFGPEAAVAVQAQECAVSFAWTEDRGRTWSNFRPVRYEGGCDRAADGAGDVVFSYRPLSTRAWYATVNEWPYLSTDRGETWWDAEAAMTLVDAFPAGSEPVLCQNDCPDRRRPLAVDPRTGTVYRLAADPVPDYALGGLYESPDGALWGLFLWRNELAPPMLARSTDRGRTWQATPSPTPEGAQPVAVAAASRRVAYLLAEPDPTATPRAETARLFRTADGGSTWRDLHTELPASDAVRAFTLGSDGSLLVADGPPPPGPDCTVRCDETQAYVWISRDGRSFTRGPAVPGNAGGTGPGRLWAFQQDAAGERARITTDGTTWTELPLP